MASPEFSNEATARPNAEGDNLYLTVIHHGRPHTFSFGQDATITNLSERIAEELSIPASNQKILISPKPGLQRPPFKDPALPLADIRDRKITLMGSTAAAVSSIESEISAAKTRSPRSGPVKAAAPARTRDWKKVKEEAEYTFHTLRPLPYLPHPERSLRFLERLRDDPGIKASMRKHKFSVPLLTEMNPAEHTTHESRTLGLNRNRGEIIELRLRTDAYDGYRDYKTIRKTLCHELAHNVWGPHDRNFWELCKEIEREVERNDWTRGGHAVSNEEFHNPEDWERAKDDDDVHDDGGWTGGEFILGGAAEDGQRDEGLSRREIIAKAAEERMRSQKHADEKSGEDSSSL